ncbi:MAG TPA: DUF3352 domain-containing protein [Gaiellaceae bacterium]|nr:DUF3352 domain-containing protein [Gaiellaceae bacterium]
MRRLSGVLAATALLAAGCGGTTAQPGSGASRIVPASAPAFIAIDSNAESSQWQTINDLASKFPDKQKGVDSIKQDLTKNGVDWEQDVKPALGDEFDLVWLDFENDGQDVVGLTQPRSEAKFKALVAQANKDASSPGDKVFYDSFKGWAVIAPAQQTIDRFEQESSTATTALADDKSFSDSMNRLGTDSVVRAYVNGTFLMQLARTKGGARVQPYIDKLGTLDWIAARLGATSEGIGLDTIVHGTPGSLFKGSSSSGAFSAKLLGTVPADALVYMSFHGAKGMFNGLQQSPALNTPQFRQFVQPLQQLGRILQGENAVYARPGANIPEVTLVSTPGTAGTPIVDRMVKKFSDTSPQVRAAGGTRVHAMASSGMGLYYADVNGKFVASDQLQGIRAAIGSRKSLSDSSEFRQAKDASGMPDKTWSALYVNIHAGVPYVEKLAHQHIPAEIARNVKPLRSAVEYAASHTHELQISFFLRIK